MTILGDREKEEGGMEGKGREGKWELSMSKSHVILAMQFKDEGF